MNVLSDDHGFTPLHWAAREGWVAIFDILVARGARINNLNNGGDTPLHCAVSKGQKAIILKVDSNFFSKRYLNSIYSIPSFY